MMKHLTFPRLALAALAGVLGFTASGQELIWLEGESAAGVAPPAAVENAGKPESLSGAQWLKVGVEGGQVAKAFPEAGPTFRVPFRADAAGERQLWARIGFEYARSPFSWRIDGGEWATVSPDAHTTDLVGLQTWTEVAWLKLGDVMIAPGEHVLEFRAEKTKDDKGKDGRLLFALDAVALSPGEFRPRGHLKPGEDHRQEIDRAAEATRYALPDAKPGERASVALKGLWQIARHDEHAPANPAEPIAELPPSDADWYGIEVPGDKNVLRPELMMAHRVWYRTTIDVPESLAGRSFYLELPLFNLNATVYVNGRLCGFAKDPFARAQIDVTGALKPGENELLVGIRDAWYGRQWKPEDPMKLRRTFNLPESFFHQGFQDFAFPVWNCADSGLLDTPVLVAAGRVYPSDVFVKPSVAEMELGAEVTLTNNRGAAASGELRWEAVDEATNRVAKTFAPQPFSLAAGETKALDLADAWPDPTLWWPDSPHLYKLRIRTVVNGEVVDTSETTFGFREWRIDGRKFTLNGVVWHLWADLVSGANSKEEWLERYHETDQRMMRYTSAGQGGVKQWFGMQPDAALDYFDRQGVVVRRNTTLDGEVIGYKFSEDDPDIRKRQGGSELKLELMQNWIDQCVAQVKGERNHPSIQIWTIENEFAYINLINLLGNSPNMDAYEREIARCAEAVKEVDPTRPAMIDGGGALKEQLLDVHGDHYVFDKNNTAYPNLAYEEYPEGGGRGRWRWDGQKPRFLGEDYYATGINPADYAMWGGEEAFLGKAQARPTMALIYRMLTEGYRWGGHYAAWHFWIGSHDAAGQSASNPWRAAFVRQWDWTFPSGGAVTRTFGVFNDTRHDAPITFTRTLTLNGEQVFTRTTEHRVAPGTAEKFDEIIELPEVAQRTEGELTLRLVVNGEEVFSDTKAVSVLPKVAATPGQAGAVAVFDPQGDLAPFLQRIGVTARVAGSLTELPTDAKVLIVGRDAIAEKQSTATTLASWASAGRVVIVLEQSHPLKYAALQADLDPMSDGKTGSVGFIEDLSHPAFRGLRQKDFFTWGSDTRLYRDVYAKPTRGGKSLLQVGRRLGNTALAEAPTGKGLMLLSQLTLAEKLDDNIVAQHLLRNLIDYGLAYEQKFRPVVAATEDALLLAALDGTGARYDKAVGVLEAMRQPGAQLVIASATPENLRLLADGSAAVESFTRAGGYLVLHGLTPEGLADFNRLVGVEHLIRPFKRERVTFTTPKHSLASGLTTGDIVLLSGERIFGWTADEYVAGDVFSYVVDYDEISRFCTSPFGSYDLITNGFVSADGWPLIINWPMPEDGSAPRVPIQFPRPENVTEFTWIGNTFYWPQTSIALTFDGDARAELDVEPNTDPQVLALESPRRVERELLLEITGHEERPGAKNTGIDDIYIKVERSPEFYAKVKPLLNVGGLVEYPRGDGGIVLCNLAFKEAEAVPLNGTKKRTILATVLRNLRAPFSGGSGVIAGANLRYTPIDISKHANQFRNERGWFGDRGFTFADLPNGTQRFAGVQYSIYEFPTSPVPTAIMLGGAGVPGGLAEEVLGIPANVKADALFFLHTARMDQPRSERDRRDRKQYEMLRYVVNYADGTSETIPVRAEIEIDDYHPRDPKPLPGAQLAWTRPYGSDGRHAAAYSMQWNNPRPDVAIRSIDVRYGPDRRGVPALLAITAAQAAE